MVRDIEGQFTALQYFGTREGTSFRFSQDIAQDLFILQDTLGQTCSTFLKVQL